MTMTTQTLRPAAPAPAPATANTAAPSGNPLCQPDAEGAAWPVTLDVRPLLGGKTLAGIDFERLRAFIDANDRYAIEYNETGELIIMPPMLMPGGNLEAQLLAAVVIWNRPYGGLTPSSATVFCIPGLGGRGPGASWVSPQRLAGLDVAQYRTGQVCPDFVAEIRSPHNSLVYLQRKMAEYIAAGTRLGWLIDPPRRRVAVYRPGREPEIRDNPETLSGEDVMPGFVFRVRELIFDAAGDFSDSL